MIIYKDNNNNFIELFNPKNGFCIRGNSLDTGSEPRQRNFPELIDMGIMGSCHVADLGICKRAGIDCYQAASKLKKPDMTYKDYCSIILQCKNRTFQVALGGAGDPNKHKFFTEMLKFTRENYIIPNYTTTGVNITDQEIEATKQFCGAVAVSFYSRLKIINEKVVESFPETFNAIYRLLSAHCVVNIHFVLSRDTIDEAIYRLNNNLFPHGINALIFILYKPVGLGIKEKMLSHKKITLLLETIAQKKFDFKIGFDTCCTPAIVMHPHTIALNSVDFCEAARFSMYIDSELKAYPCSFDCYKKQYGVSIKNSSIESAWNSNTFNKFRKIQDHSCIDCSKHYLCYGGCALDIGINICGIKGN